MCFEEGVLVHEFYVAYKNSTLRRNLENIHDEIFDPFNIAAFVNHWVLNV